MDDLERILQSRIKPPSRPNLAERIIMTVLNESERVPFWQKALTVFHQVFLLPRPAYVCAVVVLLGVVLGAGADIEDSISPEDFASVFEIHDTLNSGEWL